MQTIREHDPNITVKLSELFDLELDAVPCTGYIWEVQSTPEFRIMLEKTLPSTRMIGSAIVQRFTIRPLKLGKYVLRGTLKRPWETKVERQIALDITVN